MNVRIGTQGRCVSALRPYGLVDFDGRTIEVVTDEGWIDEGTAVYALSSNGKSLVVGSRKPVTSPENADIEIENLSSDDSPPARSHDSKKNRIPLEGPDLWLERVPFWIAGLLLGAAAAISLIVSNTDQRSQWWCLPLAGAVAGLIVQYFIKGARDLAGPYADHRPHAYGIMLVMIFGMLIGSVAGLALGGSIFFLSCGMVLGAACMGVLSVLAHGL